MNLDLQNYESRKHAPFKVPTGYMEQLPDQLMARIAQGNATAAGRKAASVWRWRKVRPVLAGAAAVCALAFCLTFWTARNGTTPMPTTPAGMMAQYDNDYVDDMCNFTMINEQDIYAACDSNDDDN